MVQVAVCGSGTCDNAGNACQQPQPSARRAHVLAQKEYLESLVFTDADGTSNVVIFRLACVDKMRSAMLLEPISVGMHMHVNVCPWMHRPSRQVRAHKRTRARTHGARVTHAHAHAPMPLARADS